MKKFFKRGFLKAAGGAAAIEAVLVIPFLAITYFGSQDVIAVIVLNKKMTDVATTVSDTVAQYKSTIWRSNVNDIENTINLIVPKSQTSKVQVDVYDYYLKGTTLTKRWSTKSPNATNCAAPNTTNFSQMMVPGNDVIVAVSCMKYTPWASTIFGTTPLLGVSTFTLTKTIAAVPYQSKVLNCYTGSSGTTPCNEI